MAFFVAMHNIYQQWIQDLTIIEPFLVPERPGHWCSWDATRWTKPSICLQWALSLLVYRDIIQQDFSLFYNHSICAARDCAVTHNGIALICRPGVEDDQGQPKSKTKEKTKEKGQNIARLQDCLSVRAVLKKELGLTVVDLESPEARLSGSDVLFTGR